MKQSKKFYVIVILILGWTSLCAAQEQISSVDPIPQLMAQPFIDPQYSRAYLKSLSSLEVDFAQEIGWQATAPAQLRALAMKFPMPEQLRESGNFELRAFVSKKDASPHMILMGLLRRVDDNLTPMGSFSAKLLRNKGGELESHILEVYFDRSDPKICGIASAMSEFFKKNIYPAVGVTHETLKADHAGRYVWAKQGFQFDPDYWFKDDGRTGPGEPTIKLPELARRNFTRFLAIHHLKPEDLLLRGRPLKSVQNLKTPDDFASVRLIRGKKIVIQPFVLGTLQPPQALDVGKAFMLSDYRPQGTRFVKSMAGTKFSVAAMPYWNGWRKP